ncbi:hypothetical protein [Actinomadura rubrisoli]|uniref:hypothetical protein n=1 Tax=Actinomadura rubrisoli TaxID=2530368 RepID=UPI0014051626|nr:hypothetical protein [Actinomadura rubrisoli]
MVLALALTCAGMTVPAAGHPPGGATTLIVALGLLRTPAQLAVLMASVVVTAAVLTALRRLTARAVPDTGSGTGPPDEARLLPAMRQR